MFKITELVKNLVQVYILSIFTRVKLAINKENTPVAFKYLKKTQTNLD